MRARRVFGYGTAVLAVCGVGLIGAVQLRWDRTFTAAEPALRASTDPAVIERGRYLAYGPAHCAYCHTTTEQWPALDAGEQPPLSGGAVFKLPLGTFYSPNLTPDPETGIGRRTDGQLARILRHGVRADGRAAMPFMTYQNLSDEDVVALISFLRAQPPVRNEVPDHELRPLGRALFAFVIRPAGPSAPPPPAGPPEGPTIERGEYLANNVAECAFCHTKRSLMDGSAKGPLFAGGLEMALESEPGTVLVSPNLTPDPATGHIQDWSEEKFIDRFRAGTLIEGSHMPWGAYTRMTDDDLRAIYRYLNSLEPVYYETGAMVQQRR